MIYAWTEVNEKKTLYQLQVNDEGEREREVFNRYI